MKLRSWLGALCFAWATAACGGPYDQGLLWKVENGSAKPSYLFGTIHSEDSRVLVLPAPVQRAFDSAGVYVMEARLDANAMTAMAGAMMFGDGRTLQQVVGDKTYARASAAAAAYGLPDFAIQGMKPWALAMTLSMPKPKTGLFLDMALMHRAREQGKAVDGLETVDEQLNALDTLSLREQAIMLEDTLRQLPEMQKMFERLHELYLARDLGRMVKLADEQQAKGDREVGKKVMDQLLTQRNRRMAERAEPYLKQGNVFIAVGALHLPSGEGMLSQLVKRGYRVSVVY